MVSVEYGANDNEVFVTMMFLFDIEYEYVCLVPNLGITYCNLKSIFSYNKLTRMYGISFIQQTLSF